MARKEYTAISLEPDAADAMRAIRRRLSAQIEYDLSLSEAVEVTECMIIRGWNLAASAAHVLGFEQVSASAFPNDSRSPAPGEQVMRSAPPADSDEACPCGRSHTRGEHGYQA